MFWDFALLLVKAVRPVSLVAPVRRGLNFLGDFGGFPTSNPTHNRMGYADNNKFLEFAAVALDCQVLDFKMEHA